VAAQHACRRVGPADHCSSSGSPCDLYSSAPVAAPASTLLAGLSRQRASLLASCTAAGVHEEQPGPPFGCLMVACCRPASLCNEAMHRGGRHLLPSAQHADHRLGGHPPEKQPASMRKEAVDAAVKRTSGCRCTTDSRLPTTAPVPPAHSSGNDAEFCEGGWTPDRQRGSSTAAFPPACGAPAAPAAAAATGDP
jgi:hypothetical protein